MVTRLVGGVDGSLLRRERRALARSTEAERARALPGERVAHVVGDGDDRVVERSLNVYQTVRHILAFALLELLVLAGFAGSSRLLCLCHLGLRRFLLACDGALARTLARARVGVTALTPGRQVAAMAVATVALDIDQALDVHRDFFARVTFDVAFLLDHLADAIDLVLAQVLNFLERIDLRAGQNACRARISDPIDVSERD